MLFRLRILILGLSSLLVLVLAPAPSKATSILEVLDPGSFNGTFVITPSVETWAFGVGNENIEDTSISGIRFIDGLEANDHWVSRLISRSSWDGGVNWDSIRPIGATAPSSFAIDTTVVPWQWGASGYVAFYYLSEANEELGPPQAVLQPGTAYDAFRFFASAPASPFAAFGAADGGTILLGETVVVPEPTTAMLLGLGMLGLAARRDPAHHG